PLARSYRKVAQAQWAPGVLGQPRANCWAVVHLPLENTRKFGRVCCLGSDFTIINLYLVCPQKNHQAKTSQIGVAKGLKREGGGDAAEDAGHKQSFHQQTHCEERENDGLDG